MYGTDTSQPAYADPLLSGVRRLTLLADGARGCEGIFRGLARELLLTPGAEEVHVHHLASPRSRTSSSMCTSPRARGA